MKKRWSMLLFVWIVMLLPASAWPPLAAAAGLAEEGVTIRASLDKTIAAADRQTADNLRSRYADLLASRKREVEWEARIKALHAANEAEAADVRKQIALIGAEKKQQLTDAAKQTRERHQKLLDSYTAVNRQIELAKTIGAKEWASVLRTQAALMKPAVQLAKDEIRAKDKALQAAKDSAAKTAKLVRDTLAGVDTRKTGIKTRTTSAAAQKKQYAAEWKSFTAAAKKTDVRTVVDSLATLVATSRQLVETREAIYDLELGVQGIVRKAKSQLP
ncbi:MAG: hypothetical protein J7639_14825 [Paenibacillaceae bacterium]|nr:hypothetical protein [Paenibacillaceae bacterium]